VNSLKYYESNYTQDVAYKVLDLLNVHLVCRAWFRENKCQIVLRHIFNIKYWSDYLKSRSAEEKNELMMMTMVMFMIVSRLFLAVNEKRTLFSLQL